MRNLTNLMSIHKKHIIASAAASLAIFCGLLIVQYLGIGGIQINPVLLGLGLILAECGHSMTCFGEKLNVRRLEYSGVLVKGMAWWVWCLNLPFLHNTQGYRFVLNLAVPALLLGGLPVAAHYARKEFFAWNSDRIN